MGNRLYSGICDIEIISLNIKKQSRAIGAVFYIQAIMFLSKNPMVFSVR